MLDLLITLILHQVFGTQKGSAMAPHVLAAIAEAEAAYDAAKSSSASTA